MTYIVYGSSTGNTEHAAELMAGKFENAQLVSAEQLTVQMLESGDFFILGTSTWGDGDLQDDWETSIDLVRQADLSGKKAAVFGFGDQEGWPDSFVSGMRELYDALQDAHAEVVGSWDPEGYEFEHSDAVEDGVFVGLALDEENQGEMNGERIEQWCTQLHEHM
jgi:flavodoxin long chain